MKRCRVFFHSVNIARFSSSTALSLLVFEIKIEIEIYLPQTISISNKKNTILKLARSRLPEKQKAIYAGRQNS